MVDNTSELLDKLERLYEESGGNPMIAWQAIELARLNERKLPTWVDAYLDWSAREIMTHVRANEIAGDHWPVRAWEAIEMAFDQQQPIPEWAMGYLEGVARRILALSKRGETIDAEDAGHAAGF